MAVLPRLQAAKQGTEASVEILESLVHLLEVRRIHLPASPAQPFPGWPLIPLYQPSL